MARGRWARVVLCVLAVVSVALPAAAGGDEERIPEVVGLPEAAATALLTAGRFPFTVKDVAGEPAGVVDRQSPGGFTLGAAGTNLTIWVRRGAGFKPGTGPSTPPGPEAPPPPSSPPGEALRVPSLVGKTEAEALELLRLFKVTIESA